MNTFENQGQGLRTQELGVGQEQKEADRFLL